MGQAPGKTDEWYTPKYVFDALGVGFDLDVASPGKSVVPWVPARRVITAGSLTKPWSGFVWMNPPFGGRNGLVPWLEKFVAHANGVALVPDRTSAPWWQKFATLMDWILFVSPKIKFIGADGQPGPSPADGTCLWSLGGRGQLALETAQVRGLGVLVKPWTA